MRRQQAYDKDAADKTDSLNHDLRGAGYGDQLGPLAGSTQRLLGGLFLHLGAWVGKRIIVVSAISGFRHIFYFGIYRYLTNF